MIDDSDSSQKCCQNHGHENRKTEVHGAENRSASRVIIALFFALTRVSLLERVVFPTIVVVVGLLQAFAHLFGQLVSAVGGQTGHRVFAVFAHEALFLFGRPDGR